MNRIELVELTNICMIYSGARLCYAEQNKRRLEGICFFPGGHVELGEPVADSVIHKVNEETGLDISFPKLCKIKKFKCDRGSYIIFFYKTDKFSSELKSFDEGNVPWIKRSGLCRHKLVSHFMKMLK